MIFRIYLFTICLLTGISGFAQVPYDTLIAIKTITIHFDFGKDALTPASTDSLLLLIRDEQKKEDHWIDIVAHTDSIGTEKANNALALRRSKAVADFLQKQNWPAAQIRKTAAGEAKPLQYNDTEEGRQANRRATITLLKRRVLTTIQGKIQHDSTGQALVADVHILAREWRDSLQSDSSGKFQYTLPAGEVVRIDIRRPGHFFSSEMVKAMPGLAPLEIRIKPIVSGAIADIQNLYFVGDQAILLPKSVPELQVLYQFMTMNPTIVVEIAGHVNLPWQPPVDTTTRHFNLSMRRAKLVYDELIQKGVFPHRLTYKGYGNWEMRFPNATTARQQALNRRVEIRILSTGEIISKKASLHETEQNAGPVIDVLPIKSHLPNH